MEGEGFQALMICLHLQASRPKTWEERRRSPAPKKHAREEASEEGEVVDPVKTSASPTSVPAGGPQDQDSMDLCALSPPARGHLMDDASEYEGSPPPLPADSPPPPPPNDRFRSDLMSKAASLEAICQAPPPPPYITQNCKYRWGTLVKANQ
jgi:hypothetical protein